MNSEEEFNYQRKAGGRTPVAVSNARLCGGAIATSISLESPIIKKLLYGAFLLLNDDLRFERVEFERIVGEHKHTQCEPYDAKGVQFEKLGIYQSRWNHHISDIVKTR